jgi:membrane protease YdiL (CAAX protease family)
MIGALGFYAVLTLLYGTYLPWSLCLLVPVAYWYFVHSYEGRSCRELGGGLVGAREFGLGLVVAILCMAGPELAIVPLGYRGHLLLGGSAALGALLSDLLAAIAEETLNRGVLLRYVELRLGSVWALVISSAVFGLLHVFQPHMGLFGVVQITVDGFAFGAAYLLTRRLWLSIGLHAGTLLAIDLFSRLTPRTSGGWGLYDLALVLDLVLAIVLIVLAARSGSFVQSDRAWPSQVANPVSRTPHDHDGTGAIS